MIINKAQGQTLTNVGVCLPQPVFDHGQLYVALSWCTDRKNLKVLIKGKEGEPGVFTRNVVYHGVLD
jgi:ATP-dependent DNA helicase PIF1